MPETSPHVLKPEKWIENHADFMYNYAIGRVNDRETAKDLVQETFLSGVRGRESFRGDASERTWLISILKRKIIDHYRKINSDKAKKEVRMSFYEEGENKGSWIEERVPQTWGNEAESRMENEELKEALQACIENLPEKYRIVFLMKTIRKFETEDICNELGITPSNLWVIIHRARTQLRSCMENKWFKK